LGKKCTLPIEMANKKLTKGVIVNEIDWGALKKIKPSPWF
jgi:hypothetical protein